jgi:hypothetical protein
MLLGVGLTLELCEVRGTDLGKCMMSKAIEGKHQCLVFSDYIPNSLAKGFQMIEGAPFCAHDAIAVSDLMVLVSHIRKKGWHVLSSHVSTTDTEIIKTFHFDRHSASDGNVSNELKDDCSVAAIEATNIVLPEGWVEVPDAEGNVYYYHTESGESTWDHPADQAN